MLKVSFKKKSLPQTPSERGGLKNRFSKISSFLVLYSYYSTLYNYNGKTLSLSPIPLLRRG